MNGSVGSVVLQRFSVDFQLDLVAGLKNFIIDLVVEPVPYHPSYLTDLRRSETSGTPTIHPTSQTCGGVNSQDTYHPSPTSPTCGGVKRQGHLPSILPHRPAEK